MRKLAIVALVVGLIIAGTVAAIIISNTLQSGDVPIIRESIVLTWETPVWESAPAIPTQALVTFDSTDDIGDSTDWFYNLSRSFDSVTVFTTVEICAYNVNHTLVTLSPTDFKINLSVADMTNDEWDFVIELSAIAQAGDCVDTVYQSGFDWFGDFQMYKLEVFVHDSIDAAATDLEMVVVATT